MTSRDMDATLRAWTQARGDRPAPPSLREQVLVIPSTTPQQRRWLSQIPTVRFQTMFSATKFVLAGVIVALFGGFLLGDVLTQQSEVQAPAAGSSSAEPTPSRETLTLLWERVEIPAGMDYSSSLRSSTGTYLIARSPDQTIVSRDGLTWSEVPVQGKVIDAYGGTLVVADGDRLSTVQVAQEEGAPGERLLALDAMALPRRVSRAAGKPLIHTQTAYGPAGLVVVACDAKNCGSSTVWHTADGQSWERVYRSRRGELWEEVIATEDGFVARTDRGGDFTVMYSADGREWVRINEPSFARYWLVGSAPFGMVLQEPLLDTRNYGRLVVVTPDGLKPLAVPAEVEARWASTKLDSWGAGGLGLVGLGIADRIVSLSTDGATWHLDTLPDMVPRLLTGWNGYGRPILHVTEDVVFLETQVCLDSDGTEVVCSETEVEGHKGAWFRGTLSAYPSSPADPTVAASAQLDPVSAAEAGAATGAPGTFSPAGSFDKGRVEHAATLLSDGRVLVIGGLSAEIWEAGER